MSHSASRPLEQSPSRPTKLTVDFFEVPDGLVLRRYRAGGPGGLFLVLWLIGWTVGCVALAAVVINEPSFGMLVFAVPFWSSWIFVAGLVMWMFFGKETLLLRHDEAYLQRSAIFDLSAFHVPRQEILAFREYRNNPSDDEAVQWGIEMVTLGKPWRFGGHLPDRERSWLIDQLNQFLREHEETNPVLSDTASRESGACVPLSRELTLEQPPSDSDWQWNPDLDALVYWQRGRLSISAVATLLFINAFWNGIVLVFVLTLAGFMPAQGQDAAPDGWGWWGMFLFLIPFEVIGLMMFLGLIYCLLEPFRRTSWRFEPDRIVSETSWPVYRRRREWAVQSLDRMELRRARSSRITKYRFGQPTTDGFKETPFELALVGSDNVDLCVIDGLTEGEVRWIGRGIWDHRGHWMASAS